MSSARGTMTADDQTNGQFRPYDIEVEQAVLAAILRDRNSVAEVAAELVPGDFFDSLHARIYEKMLVLDELERPISVITLRAILKHDKDFQEMSRRQEDAATSFDEAVDYLEALDRFAPSTRRDLPDYVRIIIEFRIHRDALQATFDATAMMERGDPVETSLAPIQRVSDELIQLHQTRKGPSGLGDAYERLAREAELAAQGKLPGGCPTGTKGLDKQLGGYYGENFIIIAGRPGMGKSILGTTAIKAAALALDPAERRIYEPVAFSLEMSGRENAARLIADLDYDESIRLGRKPMQYADILRGRLDGEEWERFVLLGQELRDWGVDIYDEAKQTMGKIAALARASASRTDRRLLVVIDHLQIIAASDRYRGNRVEELTQTTGECKALAKRLNCPVIALSQLNRSVESREDKRPNLGDLRESGSIEQDADVVMFAYRPAYYLRSKIKHARATGAKNAADLELEMERDANLLEVDCAKNRNGSTGDVRLWIDVASSAVRDEKPEEGPRRPPPQRDLYSEPLDSAAALDDLAKRTGG